MLRPHAERLREHILSIELTPEEFEALIAELRARVRW